MRLALFCFCYLLPCFIFSQNIDSTPANALLQQARILMDSANYQKAIHKLNQAQKRFKEDKDWKNYAKANHLKGSCLMSQGEYKQAIELMEGTMKVVEPLLSEQSMDMADLLLSTGEAYCHLSQNEKGSEYLERSLKIRLDQLGEDDPLVGDTYLAMASCSDRVIGFRNVIPYYKKVLEIYKKSYGENDIRTVPVYTNMGWTYGQLGDLDNQIGYYQKALDIRKKELVPTHPKLAISYHNLSACYFLMGDYHKMFSHDSMALAILLSSEKKNKYLLSAVYFHLGQYFWEIRDVHKSHEYFLKSLALDRETYGEEHMYLASTYKKISDYFLETGNLDKAESNALRALSIARKSMGEDAIETGRIYRNLANLSSKKGDYASAIREINRSIRILEKQTTPDHPTLLANYMDLGQYWQKAGDERKELSYYRKVLGLKRASNVPLSAKIYYLIGNYFAHHREADSARAYYDEGINDLLSQNQSDEGKLSNLREPQLLVDLLHAKAQLLFEAGKAQQAFEHFNQAIDVMEELRFSLESMASRQSFTGDRLLVFEGAIAAAWQLYEQHDDPSWLEKAFTVNEKSKASVLHQTLKDAEAKREVGIPKDILDLEREIAITRTYYRKKLFEERQKGKAGDAEKRELWQQKIFDLGLELESIKSETERLYPRYAQLKYQKTLSRIPEIQQVLVRDSAYLIEYFVGDEHVFVFVLDGSEIRGIRLDMDFPIEQWVNDYREGMYIQHHRNNQLYEKAAFQLYKHLFQPITEAFPNLPERIHVVPDGPLGYVSFDALISQNPVTTTASNNLPYLIYDYQFSYVYSANLLLTEEKRKLIDPIDCLVLSPSYDADGALLADGTGMRTGYEELVHSKPEVMAINRMLGGELLIDEMATEENFKREAGKSRIIHISSHANVNDQNPMYSRIVLTVDPKSEAKEDGFLEVAELFNLDLQAEMVVLSACETGIGKLYRGEGIVSLAQGFFFAGTQSIITTLWRVNDASTYEIMEHFYEQLKNGQPKDAALRQSKLTYLENSDQLHQHPFYWSGIIPIGNMEALGEKQSDSPSLYWLVLLFAIGGWGLWKIRTRRKMIS